MSTQELIAVAIPTIIPTLAIILSIFRSDANADRLRTEMNSLRIEVRAEISTLRTEMNGMRSDLHTDIRILNNVVLEHAQRITTLEKSS